MSWFGLFRRSLEYVCLEQIAARLMHATLQVSGTHDRRYQIILPLSLARWHKYHLGFYGCSHRNVWLTRLITKYIPTAQFQFKYILNIKLYWIDVIEFIIFVYNLQSSTILCCCPVLIMTSSNRIFCFLIYFQFVILSCTTGACARSSLLAPVLPRIW